MMADETSASAAAPEAESSSPASSRKRSRRGTAPDDAETADLLALLPDRVINEGVRRTSYSEVERAAVLQVLAALGGNKRRAVQVIKQKPGYERLLPASLRLWLKGPGSTNVGGRPVNSSFEAFVYASLEKGAEEPWAVIRDVATLARSLLPWATDETVQVRAFLLYCMDCARPVKQELKRPEPSLTVLQRLALSDRWIMGMLRRQAAAAGHPAPQKRKRRKQRKRRFSAAGSDDEAAGASGGAEAEAEGGPAAEAAAPAAPPGHGTHAATAADELLAFPPFDLFL
jgi:hypothetical protein